MSRVLPRVPRRLALAALIVAAAVLARSRIAPYERHTSRIEAVASTIRTEWPREGTVAVMNLPAEITGTVFPWVLGSYPSERLKLWTVITTRASCARPAAGNGPEPPVADTWFEFDGRGLRRTSWAEIDARHRAPAIWLATTTHVFAGPEEAISEVLAEPRPLEEANLVSEQPPLPQAASPPGTARLIAHRVIPEKGYEWEVEAALARPGLLVLSYVPLPGFMVEFLSLDTFVHPVPPPLRVEVLDASTRERREFPISFVNIYFPGLLLPAGSHRLVVRGMLPF